MKIRKCLDCFSSWNSMCILSNSESSKWTSVYIFVHERRHWLGKSMLKLYTIEPNIRRPKSGSLNSRGTFHESCGSCLTWS